MVWMVILGVICFITTFMALYCWTEVSFVSSIKYMAISIGLIVISILIQNEDNRFYTGIGYFVCGIIFALFGLFMLLGGASGMAGRFIAVGVVVTLVGLFGFGLYSDFTDDNTSTYEDYDYDDDYNYHDNGYSQSSHDCYVCGKDGNIFYGSHYYCPTHYAYVKTVVDSYGDGEKYNPNDKLYSDNDHNNDGYINQNEWEDALGDYMDSIMGY